MSELAISPDNTPDADLSETNSMDDVEVRHPPEHPEGIKRVQVGCGPKNIMAGWWNVDIRQFTGIDEVMDVTEPWRWKNTLDFVYGEHFLEHLSVEGSLQFLQHAGAALRVGGKIRLSTPCLEWVLSTHFDLGATDDLEHRRTQTFAINRAFHGWGHKFLYSKEMLEAFVRAVGFDDIRFYDYGVSETNELVELERHGGGGMSGVFPRVWIIEAEKTTEAMVVDKLLVEEVEENFGRYVRCGH